MQVNTNFGASGTPDVPPARPAVRQAEPGADEAAFTNIVNLQNALGGASDVRPDKVAQARSLLSDPSYPSNAVLGRVADVLAGNINSAPEAD